MRFQESRHETRKRFQEIRQRISIRWNPKVLFTLYKNFSLLTLPIHFIFTTIVYTHYPHMKSLNSLLVSLPEIPHFTSVQQKIPHIALHRSYPRLYMYADAKYVLPTESSHSWAVLALLRFYSRHNTRPACYWYIILPLYIVALSLITTPRYTLYNKPLKYNFYLNNYTKF